MKPDFLEGFEFFTGVPDSQLKPFCDYLMTTYGISERHIIAANEGNAVALAAGYYLSTGKVPVVYLQNSGVGNIVNPVASLLNDRVYGIPCLFVIGWRGEPGIQDEPQHKFQGDVTLKLLDDMEIASCVIKYGTTKEEIADQLALWKPNLAAGKQVAFVVRKGTFDCDATVIYSNTFQMLREDIIKQIVKVSGDDIIVSTTGKASRELYEVRDTDTLGHEMDFLTVGSMGHSSSIALGIALNTQGKKVWIIDGDGAALMHMGAMAVIGSLKPNNIVHIVINNNAHETVGGMPTVANSIDLVKIAQGCGYPCAVSVTQAEQLVAELDKAGNASALYFIEVKSAIGSRANLGRPKTTPLENRDALMKYLGIVK